jgi:small redox-active disulfide protein 2
MIRIEVLGPGCKKCEVLYERVSQAAQEMGVEHQIEKITEIEKIIAYGVMATPALVVNGAVKLSGRVPTAEHLKEYLK